ncbi:UNVERIFIED_CONTAM: hypothetical protein RMT77_008106 [Armadillidium vulgare]
MIWSGLVVFACAGVIAFGLATPIDPRSKHFIPSNDGAFQYTVKTGNNAYISPQEANTPVISSSGGRSIPDYFKVTDGQNKKQVKYIAGTGFLSKPDYKESTVVEPRSDIPIIKSSSEGSEGDYFYVVVDGVKKKVKYVAGTGFVAKSDNVGAPQDSAAILARSAAATAAANIPDAKSASEGDYFYINDGGIEKKVKYVAGTGFVAASPETRPDSRAISSFPSENVATQKSEGEYFYVNDGGIKKKVKYISGTGFLFKNENPGVADTRIKSDPKYNIPVIKSSRGGTDDYFSVFVDGIKKSVKYVPGTGFQYKTDYVRGSPVTYATYARSNPNSKIPFIKSFEEGTEGDYFYVIVDGIQKKVKYVSGSGFVYKSEAAGASPETPTVLAQSDHTYDIPSIRSSDKGTEDYFYVIVDGTKKKVKYSPGSGFVYKADYTETPATLIRSDPKYRNIPVIKSSGEGTGTDYFYVFVDGIKKKVKYTPGVGFVYKKDYTGISPETPTAVTTSDAKYDIPSIRSSGDGVEDYFDVVVDGTVKKVKFMPGAGFVYKAGFPEIPATFIKSDPKYSNIPVIRSSGKEGEGDYFYVFVDGIKKKVKYTPGTGFVYKLYNTEASPETLKTTTTLTKSDIKYDIPSVRSSGQGTEDYFYVIVDGIKKHVKYVPGAGFVYKADFTKTPEALLRSDPKYNNIPVIRSSTEGTEADYFYVLVDGVKKKVKYTPGIGFVYKTGNAEPSPQSSAAFPRSVAKYETPSIRSSTGGTEDYFYVVVDGIQKKVKYTPGAGFVYKSTFAETPATLLKSADGLSNIPTIRSSAAGTEGDYFNVFVDGIKKKVSYVPGSGFVYKKYEDASTPLLKSGSKYETPSIRSSVGGVEDYFYVTVDGIKKKVKYTPGTGFVYKTDFAETPATLLKSADGLSNIPAIKSSVAGTEGDYFNVFVDGIKKKVSYVPGAGFVYKKYDDTSAPLLKSGSTYETPTIRSSVGGVEDYFYVTVDGIKKKVKYTPGTGFVYKTDFAETPATLLKSATGLSNIPTIRSSVAGTEGDYFNVVVDGIKKKVSYVPGAGFVYKKYDDTSAPLLKSGSTYETPTIRSSVGGVEDYFYVVVDGIKKKVKYTPETGFVYKTGFAETPATLLKSAGGESNIPTIRSSVAGTEGDYFNVVVDGIKKKVSYVPGSGFVYKKYDDTLSPLLKSGSTYETPTIRSSVGGVEDYFYVVVDGIKKKVKYTPGTGFAYKTDFTETPSTLLKSAGGVSNIPTIRSSVAGTEGEYFNVVVDGIKKKVSYVPGAGFVYKKYDDTSAPLLKSGSTYETPTIRSSIDGVEDYFYAVVDGIKKKVKYTPGAGFVYKTDFAETPATLLKSAGGVSNIPTIRSSVAGTEGDYFNVVVDGIKKKVSYVPGTGFVYKKYDDTSAPLLKSGSTYETPTIRSSVGGVEDYFYVVVDGIKKKVKYTPGTGFVYKTDFLETPSTLLKSAGGVSNIPTIRSSVAGTESDYFNVIVDGIKKKVSYVPGSGFVYKKYEDTSAPLVKSRPNEVFELNVNKPVRSIGDATYSFNYQTPDSSRREVADADNTVKGSYTYVGDDGITRQVHYVAGKGIGFVARGDHIPRAPETPIKVVQSVKPNIPVVASKEPSVPVVKSPAGGTEPDYIYVTDGGIQKKVKYVANTGFVSKSEDFTQDPEGTQYTSKYVSPSNLEARSSRSSIFFRA